ncbi:MAG: helix-turn-helix domain-containing protein [Lachnospiraceae bacterium]|nr:helix-turn-helix domain-containing protein [Lachnospiraceae bacterium]
MERSRGFIATPPGATIKEQIIDRGMSQKEFAMRMGMSEKHISKLINGEVHLTVDMARRLELVLGVPLQFWCNLETIYREKLAKVIEENAMDADILLAKKFPYKEMAQNGWVEETAKVEDKVINLRKFFEVVQLDMLQCSLIPAGIACRKLSETEKSYYALLAWAQKAKLEGRKVKTEPIDIKLLKKSIPEIRKMTRMPAREFCKKLSALLAECGIAIVFLPHIGGSFLHGATFYDGNKIVLGLTVRGKDADKFWFSLFHELAHIIYGHIGKIDGTTDEDEKVADLYASETLIPEERFNAFAQSGNITESKIKQFADEEGIDAGIVLGRLQKYGYVQYGWYKNLKKQYIIV